MSCTQHKDHLCDEIKANFNSLKTSLLSHSDETKTKTVKILYFDNVDVITKKGKHIKRLKAHHKDVNIPFVPDFITSLLPKIIHHINLLKNYHTNMKTILESIDNCIVVGLDFSENLTVPVKQEPQSLHYGQRTRKLYTPAF